MARKIGVYVCRGCGIGECLNTERLVEIAEKELGVPVVRTSPAFCLDDVQAIKDDIAADGVDTVVIAACSQRVNTDVFALDPATVERVNIREQVAWSHAPGDAEAQRMAEDHLRMGVVRAGKRRHPAPFTEANERRILVVGGGIAGMTAALEAAGASHQVVLVDTAPALGGFAARLHRQYPKRPPYQALEPTGIADTVAAVEGHGRIQVHTAARVARVAGQPGGFRATIARDGEAVEVTAGAIVLATGWRPMGEEALGPYGFGRVKNVITTAMLEEMVADGAVRRPSDGGPVKTAAIVQVDSDEDQTNIAYAGNVAHLVALKQAVYLREDDHERLVYLVYRDMNSPGQSEYFYQHVQQDARIFLTRANQRAIGEDEDGRVVIDLDETVLGGPLRIRADLLVLGAGMAPATPGAEGLNLEYLQGEGLPVNRFRYPDSNFVCFPYETRRSGIYTAGCVRQPMDLAQSARDGAAAALKAIQCIEHAAAGAAVHPRVGDLTFPDILVRHCTQCGRCTEECPFGALELNSDLTPRVNPNRCRRCGICMGGCPVQVISFADYSVDMLSSMIRAAHVAGGSEPRILVLACENDAYPALDMAGINRRRFTPHIRVISVRCQGSVNRALVTDALTHGFDGVALMGCKSGEDYQCHFIHGSELLDTRMANIREVMGRLALDPERVRFMEVAISESDKVPALLEEMAETISQLGPNPLRMTA
jgi:quinone-modifying oxidoreductase subunit QmoB